MPSALEIEPILPHYLDILKAIMQSHGGALEATTAFFPEGTVKKFLWPRTLDCRYLIIFPDKYEVLLVESRDGRHALGFDPTDLVCPYCHQPI